MKLKHGKRAQGGQKKRYKDTLKSSLKAFNVDSLETLATDRTSWHSVIKKGAATCEEKTKCCRVQQWARKGALKIFCSNAPYPEYRSWRGPYIAVETHTNPKRNGR